MEAYTAYDPEYYTVTPRLRWFKPKGKDNQFIKPVLQQFYQGSKGGGYWEDVPTECENAPQKD